MQHELNHIVQTLLGNQNLDEVSRENLASLTREFPYSPILHLLYSKKLQQMQDPHFAESVAQTALYFSNPHWLNSLLRPKSSRDALQEMEDAYAQTHHAEVVQKPTPVIHEELPATAEPVMEEVPSVTQEQIIEEQNTELPVEEKAEMPALEPVTEDLPAEVQEQIIEAQATEQPVEGMAEIPTPEPVTEDLPAEVQEQIIEAQTTEQPVEGMAEMPAPEPAIEGIPDDDSAKHWAEPDIRVLDKPAEGIPETWPAVADNERPEASPDQRLEQKEPMTGPEETSPAPALEEKKSVHEPALGGLIPIEPLYTIDYFASQGIQLTDEEKQDPLGRKLKSFTEWLKTMKKVHPEKTKMSMDDKTEGNIKEGAEHSNDRAEVVTEAMAEVYLKQGLKHKALEVYQKLSLLNPSHSANFAAKIAELKATES